MGHFSQDGQILIWRENQETVWLQPWGRNGLRIQANLAGKRQELPQALLEKAPGADVGAVLEISEQEASIRNGLLLATVSREGRIRYTRTDNGNVLLEELATAHAGARRYRHKAGGVFQLEAQFGAREGERFYGLGQHQHGRLDQKGCVIELQQRNTEVSIPFLVSSRKYGFLWNNPAVGRVELGHNATRWVADAAQQLDYVVMCGETVADILQRYAEATGHAPAFPEWASGFWQCKLRYETQDEVLGVAREYKRRGLPLSVIVVDFFHWTHMGDWKFDPQSWPDPAAMVRELESLGVKTMVSIWPTVIPLSENYAVMRERGLLIGNERGVDAQQVFVDQGVVGPAYYAYYDATHPEARQFHWDVVRKNYYAKGVKLFWLDNDEPDVNPWHPENLRFHIGNGLEVANLYPLLHQMAYDEGLRAEGETDVLTLSRSAWAGSQRYGAAVWSGDIASTFEALRQQVRAGLNIAMSGIPWWTTDIGGFHGGDVTTPGFRELVVRWFQFGVFCPICRLHGYRLPPPHGPFPLSGAGNEVWSFGNEPYAILRDLLLLRERLRPYIHLQMRVASARGLPLMRPVFVDFPDDDTCETIEDQFMFGPDILVAPILEEGARDRRVYLPAGTNWLDARSGAVHAGGQWIAAPAPLDTIPVFLKEGSGLRDVFTKTTAI